ncbi:hypothetical protein JXL83_07455 [candidate division WOR-3 bacterium]|nr:hypothetical protein [candidate division WOR-3 bacterium]
MQFIIFALLISAGYNGAFFLHDVFSEALDRCRFLKTGIYADEESIGIPMIPSGFHASSCDQITLSEETFSIKAPETYYLTDTLVITSDTSINEDIIIFQNGLLVVSSCSLRMRGDIVLSDEGMMKLDNAVFFLDESYVYQYSINSYGNSSFEAEHSTLRSNSKPFGFSLYDSSSTVFDSVRMDKSFITFSLTGKSAIEIKDSDKAGEFVLFTEDSAELRIKNSDSVLVWLGFPINSSGTVRGPHSPSMFIEHFRYPDTSCSGINYSVEIDSVFALFLATMACDSTNVIVFDVDLRAVGSLFTGQVSDTLSGFVDNTHYVDFTAPFPGRSYRLVNTSVQSWNFYFWGRHDVTLKNSIFGEFLCGDSSVAFLSNVICDGSGGHIGNADSSFLICALSSFYTDALLEGKSLSLFYNANFFYGRVIAADRSLAISYNTAHSTAPFAEDSGAVLIAGFYPPDPCCSNDSVPIPGSAYCVRAPFSPFNFAGYRIEYAPLADTFEFFEVSPFTANPVVNGELCVFNTSGLSAGSYLLRMWYLFTGYSYSDSMPFTEDIEIIEGTGTEELKDTEPPKIFSVSCLRGAIQIDFQLLYPEEVGFIIFDAAGRKVLEKEKRYFSLGRHSERLMTERFSSGIYFVSISFSGTKLLTEKILLFDN